MKTFTHQHKPRKQRQEAVRLQRAFFDAVGPNIRMFAEMMNTLPNVGFYIKDACGRIIMLNRHNCELSGFSSEAEAIGKTSQELFPAEYSNEYANDDECVRKTGKPLLRKISYKHADRALTPDTKNIFPLVDADGKIVGTACLHFRTRAAGGFPGSSAILNDTRDFIAKNLNGDLSTESLARRVRLSVSRFRHLFKETIGLTVAEFVTSLRIEAAVRLLTTTNRTIADIAAATGFFDHSHFIRIFRQAKKMPPGAYRLRHWSAAAPDRRR